MLAEAQLGSIRRQLNLKVQTNSYSKYTVPIFGSRLQV